MIPDRTGILLKTMTKDTLGKFFDETASVEVVEVVAPVDGAIALLVLPEINSGLEGETLSHVEDSRFLKFPPDIRLPEAGLAVLHVPLVVAHSHGGVVRIVAPESTCLMRLHNQATCWGGHHG